MMRTSVQVCDTRNTIYYSYFCSGAIQNFHFAPKTIKANSESKISLAPNSTVFNSLVCVDDPQRSTLHHNSHTV